MKRRLKEFGALTPAEQRLRDELHLGRRVVIGDGERPAEDAGEDRQIRAEFLRYLCLGGCDALPGKVPENGVWITGARITGQLDLQGATVKQDILLMNCRLDAAPNPHGRPPQKPQPQRLPPPRPRPATGCTPRAVSSCSGAEVTGTVRLVGAKLGGGLVLRRREADGRGRCALLRPAAGRG